MPQRKIDGEIPIAKCPDCQTPQPIIPMNVFSDQARDRDYLVCFGCHQILFVAPDNTLHRITLSEWNEVLKVPDLVAGLKRRQHTVSSADVQLRRKI